MIDEAKEQPISPRQARICALNRLALLTENACAFFLSLVDVLESEEREERQLRERQAHKALAFHFYHAWGEH